MMFTVVMMPLNHTLNTKSKQFFYQNVPLKEVVGNFLEYIQFHKIPANVLMREIHPLGLVPYSIIMNALAYQVNQQYSSDFLLVLFSLFPSRFLFNLEHKTKKKMEMQLFLSKYF